MRNRMIGQTLRSVVAIGLLVALAGCVVEPAYGPGPYYYHPHYYHWYDR
jgi:hypothetical protein